MEFFFCFTSGESSASDSESSEGKSGTESFEGQEQSIFPEGFQPVLHADTIKEILGKDPVTSIKTGPPVNEDTATYWASILKNGLNVEARKDLMEKYPISANCVVLRPPSLNEEISVGLQDTSIRQDNFFCHIQEQMGAGLSALVAPIEHLVKQGDASKELLQNIVDSSKLLTDIHHTISIHRRYMLSNHLKPGIKKVADKCLIDTHLFGESFSQTIKNSQEIQKVGFGLTKPLPIKSPFSSRASSSTANVNRAQDSLNWKRRSSWKKKKREERNPTKVVKRRNNYNPKHTHI